MKLVGARKGPSLGFKSSAANIAISGYAASTGVASEKLGSPNHTRARDSMSISRPNYQTTASEDMCPSRTMNSTKNKLNLSNYIAGASNDQSFDFTSNKGPMSGKFRASYNMGAGTRNNRMLLNKNASNASPKFSSNFGEGYETEGNL